MSIGSNLSLRLRLLRVALTKRFVHGDIQELALAYGNLPIGDIIGDLAPIELLRRVTVDSLNLPLPDFTPIRAADFGASGSAPASWNSEAVTARFVGELVAVMQARTVFEIGCFTGFTSAHIATALRGTAGSHFHYLDFDAEHLAATTRVLTDRGLAQHSTPHLGASVDPKMLAELPNTADLIFIDTTHEYNDTVAEIAAYGPRLTAQGVLVLHDSIRFPGVRKAINEAQRDYRVLTIATERGNGLTVLLPRGTERMHR